MRGGRIENKSAKAVLALTVLVDVHTRDLLVETQLSSVHGAAVEGLNLVHLLLYLFSKEGNLTPPGRPPRRVRPAAPRWV